jgi:hypothetical protein
VPDDVVADTLLELEQHFGAVSSETQTIRGFWRHEGESYRDQLTRIFVDIAHESEHREFFLEIKGARPLEQRGVFLRLLASLLSFQLLRRGGRCESQLQSQGVPDGHEARKACRGLLPGPSRWPTGPVASPSAPATPAA